MMHNTALHCKEKKTSKTILTIQQNQRETSTRDLRHVVYKMQNSLNRYYPGYFITPQKMDKIQIDVRNGKRKGLDWVTHGDKLLSN